MVINFKRAAVATSCIEGRISQNRKHKPSGFHTSSSPNLLHTVYIFLLPSYYRNTPSILTLLPMPTSLVLSLLTSHVQLPYTDHFPQILIVGMKAEWSPFLTHCDHLTSGPFYLVSFGSWLGRELFILVVSTVTYVSFLLTSSPLCFYISKLLRSWLLQ